MDQFVCRLRQKAISCEFENVDEAIRDRIIERCRDPRLRRKYFEKIIATLKDSQDLARVQEAVNMQVKAMDQSSGQVKLYPANLTAKEKENGQHREEAEEISLVNRLVVLRRQK